MDGLNIDPRNVHGDPSPAELLALGVKAVRFTFKDSVAGREPGREAVRFYVRRLEDMAGAGIRSLVILTNESFPNKPPAGASDEEWADYITGFATRAAEIAKALVSWQPVFQIWNAPDHVSSTSTYEPTLREAVYGRLLGETYQAIKDVDPALKVITAGLVSGQPEWLAAVIDSLGGNLPADAIALHPYTKRPEAGWPDPDWGTGEVGELINAYGQVVDLPFWITEIGMDSPDGEAQADYLRRFYQTINA
jgi:hypothetical protein